MTRSFDNEFNETRTVLAAAWSTLPDVLRSPTQFLGSERFANLVQELRLRYDRVIIDTPPIATVSDAMNILPLVDGVILVIRFNMVKRKTAAINIKRLRESNVPVMGAVLNNLNTQVAGYYYSHYYDKSYKSYKHYYLNRVDEHQDTTERPITSGNEGSSRSS